MGASDERLRDVGSERFLHFREPPEPKRRFATSVMSPTSSLLALVQGPRMTFEGSSRRPVEHPEPRDGDPSVADLPDEIPDADLVARVAADGDAVAFEALVLRHQRAVIGYLVGLLGEREEALDTAQEVFVRLYTRATKYHPSGSFRAWLFRIATNVAIDAIRSRRRRFFGWTRRQRQPAEAARPLTDDLAALPDPRIGVLDGIIERERDSVVQKAVQTLPPRYRAALVLRDLQDLSYEEAAVALGVRVGTVKSRVNRARNLLREKLAAYRGGAA